MSTEHKKQQQKGQSALTSYLTYPLAIGGKFLFHSLLQNIQLGSIAIEDEQTGHVAHFNSPTATAPVETKSLQTTTTTATTTKKSGGQSVRILLHRPQPFYTSLFLSADIGFAESFIRGDFSLVSSDDGVHSTCNLTTLLKLFIANRNDMNNLSSSSAYLTSAVNYLQHSQLANTIKNSLSNIQAHYDLGNELFKSFLDLSMTYSSALFRNPSDTLYQAQMNKLDHIIQKAGITSDDFVLEIGTGWGSFCMRAVQTTGCRIVSITLSKEQLQFAQDKIDNALTDDLADRIELLLVDYRRLPELYPENRFDKIVSIEMLEAVGPQFLSTYFQVVDKMLNRQHGRMVFQCITMPEPRYAAYLQNCDFIQRYIFPGGHCPSVSALVEAIRVGSASQLVVENLENIGPHYAKTLRLWRETFEANYESQLASFEKFLPSQSTTSDGNDEVVGGNNNKVRFYSEEFKRKWIYYFCYCEAGFAMRVIGNVQMVLTRDGNVDMLKGIEDFVL